MSDQHRFESRIRRGLDDLGAGASHLAASPPAADIRRRAARRRNVLAAGAITAAMVLGGGVVLAADALDQASIGPVSVPTTTPSPSTVPDEPTPTTAQASPPPPAPPTTTTALATTSPSTLPPDAAGEPATEIPAGFTIPREGETSDDSQFSDWETVDELSTPWSWEVCGVDTYNGDALRTDFRRVAMSGLEASAANALAVWGDALDAVDVMTQMRDAIESCTDHLDESGFVTSWDMRVLGAGGESFLAVSSSTTPDGGGASGGVQVAVVRVGNAIYATYVFADGGPTLDDTLAGELEAHLGDFAPRMCVFTVAGC